MKQQQFDRVDQVLSLADELPSFHDFGLLRSSIRCLSLDETAELCRRTATTNYDVRRMALNRLMAFEEPRAKVVRRSLATGLLRQLADADSSSSQSIAYALSVLRGELAPKQRDQIWLAFVSSRFVGLRRRAYRATSDSPSVRIPALRNAWQLRRDPEAAWLLVKELPVAALAELRDELELHLSRPYMRARLLLRLVEAEAIPESELSRLDGVSYAYVMAKLGRPLPAERVISLVREHAGDERFDLLIWALGKLGQWDSLMWIRAHYSEITDLVVKGYQRRYDA